MVTDLQRPVGELRSLHRADQLAVRERRSRWSSTSSRRASASTTPFDARTASSIPAGAYHWLRYRLEAGSAAKRALSAQATWRFGGFYSGTLDQVLLVGAWHPASLVGIEFSGERDLGDLPEGRFTVTLVGVKVESVCVAQPQRQQLRAVRHRQPIGRHEHAAALDLRAGRRSLRRSTTTTCATSTIAGGSTPISCSSRSSMRSGIEVGCRCI